MNEHHRTAARVRNLKVASVILLLVTVLVGYLGYRHLRQSRRDSVVRSEQKLLNEFVAGEEIFKKKMGRFDSSMRFEGAYTPPRVRLLHAQDSSRIRELCSDCLMTDEKFRISAFSEIEGTEIIWTIDERGNLRDLLAEAERLRK